MKNNNFVMKIGESYSWGPPGTAAEPSGSGKAGWSIWYCIC